MSSPVLAKPEYDVLNVVALKKMATPSAVAHVTGQAPDEVDRVMADLSGQGLVVIAGGAALPTNEAEPALKSSASEHYADVRTDPSVGHLVERFETVNSQFLTAMSSWQQISIGDRKVTNDHSDSDYDQKVLSQLEKLTQRLLPLLDALAGHDPRFRRYPQRFDAAMDGVDGGRQELVSSATEDSIHNIWHEFHEDLLRTLGRERTE